MPMQSSNRKWETGALPLLKAAAIFDEISDTLSEDPRDKGPTLREGRILLHILANPGSTQLDLVTALTINQSSVSRHVIKFEAAGLIEGRYADEKMSRVTAKAYAQTRMFYPTAKGQQLASRISGVIAPQKGKV